jgi:hypothetical protein
MYLKILSKFCRLNLKFKKFYLKVSNNSSSLKSFFKSPYRAIKHSSYFNVYDHLFTPYKNKNIIFVEIGVFDGGSLFMWRDFFGPKARIIGIDVNPNVKILEKYGFEILIGDQEDKKFWIEFKKKIGKVDILLDDGGHTYRQQIITVESMINNIKDEGIIVVEDTHTSYLKGYGLSKFSFINYVKNLIDKINNRFHELNKKFLENNFWSIEIFESFVVFRVNKKALRVKSFPIKNNGKFLKETSISDLSTISKFSNFKNWLKKKSKSIVSII